MRSEFVFETIGAVIAVAMSVPSVATADLNQLASPKTVMEGGRLVLAQQFSFVEDTGAANRIVAGDILRTLSQEIPAAVCHLHNNVDVAEARELLSYSVAKFDAVALALLHGNEEMGIIGGETRRKTVVELEALIETWEPKRIAAMAVLDDPTDATAAEIVYASADEMLEKTYHLLSELEGEYANPVELLASDMMLLEVSGRMAAMTQRMAYEACRVWSGDGDAHALAELDKSISIFEASMDALSNGMPALGVLAPPTPEIEANLEDVASDWEILSGYLSEIRSGADVSLQVREDLYHRLALKLYKVEELEELYQDYSKRVY
ncbi:type IV pili methyl-accepting chemotaxis transducer N-terminal domain-containing protein [Cognatiyoonia sp. IB215446]|uniref:type IV pili methyl-accepting chemotaxis transducer N-terminal domain-containing protein n=1 Tax=Cognatiyoonia sp. IB215446 TaxID=3097355 RepID=UPI002A0F73E3|nr:type IV pili methyl-accepting chemotaxis transducer N-terminal domain-containing protein [Cognatiyoonia sp. IB215446]MDX8346436.1 type IV pili methyl-accepting chemotaxis transducer N-terminal domain-containing protein [Cognatiyoonia sp. IB215446]